MYTAELHFEVGAHPPEDVEDALYCLLGPLWKNGQILSERHYPIVNSPTGFVATVRLPAADALNAANNSTYVASAYRELSDKGIRVVPCGLGRDPTGLQPCDCSELSWLVLFTNCFSGESPLRCGDCFGPIPLYRAPLPKSGEYLHILNWEDDYKAWDILQLHNCGEVEQFALRQMENPDSSLSRKGLAICQEITTSMAKPVYYFLFRYRGENVVTERDRRCPACGGDWLLDESIGGLFDFRCDQCRLLSNIACDLEE